MKIAILAHGVSPFAHQYARVFGARGHPTAVWSISSYDGTADVPLRVVGPPEFKPWDSRARLGPYLKTARAVRRAVREERPDILFAAYMTSGGVLACLSGHPRVVVSAQGSDVNSHLGSRLWRAIFRWEGRRAVIVHAVSDALAEALRDRVGVPPEKLLVAPMGVETDVMAYVDPAERPHTGQILNVRAHRPVYDQATFVRALVRLKQRGVRCHATFAHAMEVESTRRLVAECGVQDKVTFINGYTLAELPRLLASADVYVSASRSDGTSQALLEALSTGTFPVVSDIPANQPWVTHGKNGYLFPVGDDAALADRLAEALAQADRRAAAAPLSRRIAVEKGDLPRQAQRLLDAFEKCLAEKR